MRDRAKWDAWKAVEGIGLKFMVVGYWFIFFDTTVSFFFFFSGKSKEEAMSDYITKVKQLLEEAAASA
jgi:diazepam-binding inhibitor (GABA receptor modulating acyl-CoA-binding protein)